MKMALLEVSLQVTWEFQKRDHDLIHFKLDALLKLLRQSLVRDAEDRTLRN